MGFETSALEGMYAAQDRLAMDGQSVLERSGKWKLMLGTANDLGWYFVEGPNAVKKFSTKKEAKAYFDQQTAQGDKKANDAGTLTYQALQRSGESSPGVKRGWLVKRSDGKKFEFPSQYNNVITSEGDAISRAKTKPENAWDACAEDAESEEQKLVKSIYDALIKAGKSPAEAAKIAEEGRRAYKGGAHDAGKEILYVTCAMIDRSGNRIKQVLECPTDDEAAAKKQALNFWQSGGWKDVKILSVSRGL